MRSFVLALIFGESDNARETVEIATPDLFAISCIVTIATSCTRYFNMKKIGTDVSIFLNL